MGPIAEYKRFISMKGLHPSKEGHQVLGFRVQGSFLTGYGGLVAPPFERFYLGGDQDLRGFDIRSVSPVAFIATTGKILSPILMARRSPWIRATIAWACATVPVPIQSVVFPGGDTSIVSEPGISHPTGGAGKPGSLRGYGYELLGTQLTTPHLRQRFHRL